ncbi:MAG: BlaI/MecI/CopY family transcriptional regulator [archaeon]
MPDHDSFKQLEGLFGDAEELKKISPKFAELSLDLNEISRHCKEPMFLAVLLFKLAEEREKTNKLLAEIHDQFDQIMFKMKTTETAPLQQMGALEPSSILSEQDQMIMHMVQSNGRATAEEIKAELGYKGKNAASQRLNRLFKEGHLRKLQSGRKVLYLARNIQIP